MHGAVSGGRGHFAHLNRGGRMAREQLKRIDGYDVVIAGGGTCACVLAKDLARAGKKVILIEKGGRSLKGVGSMMGMMNGQHMERGEFPNVWGKTVEGQSVVIGTGVGGGSYLYAGIVGMPEFKAFDGVGVDLRPYVEDAKKETWASQTPDAFIGPVTRRMLEVTNSIGLPFEPAYRHIRFDRCEYACKKAAFGCARQAKWMGIYVADEAEQHGARLQIHTRVEHVVVEDGQAVGVIARGLDDGQGYEIRGKTVVCSAGGIGTAGILMKSGVEQAGTRLFGDPSFGSWGVLPKGLKGHFCEHGTSISYMDDEHGCLFSTQVTWPRSFWASYQLMEGGVKEAMEVYRHFPQMVAIFNKIHDEGVGRATWDGRVSKTVTAKDEEKMNYCRWVNEKILIAAGCDPNNLHHHGFSHAGALTFGHPGGSCPIGVTVDNNMETKIKNLFVCDISAMPGAPSRPPVLTLVTLTKRFVPLLLKRLDGHSR